MRFLLSALIAMLVIPANAQSLWRNFFTTNQNPIVDVVAGSNATVQASTVGSNLRRFTVNSTGSGTPQTNISYVAVTNAPWQQGSANLTNWGSISTNESAFLANNQVFAGSNFFTKPLTLSIASNTPSAGQVLTASSTSSAEWKALSGGSGIGLFSITQNGTNVWVNCTNSIQILTATNDLNFVLTNLTQGASVTVDCSAGTTNRYFAFDTNIVWIGTPSPVLLISNHVGFIRFLITGTTTNSVRGFYGSQIP